MNEFKLSFNHEPSNITPAKNNNITDKIYELIIIVHYAHQQSS